MECSTRVAHTSEATLGAREYRFTWLGVGPGGEGTESSPREPRAAESESTLQPRTLEYARIRSLQVPRKVSQGQDATSEHEDNLFLLTDCPRKVEKRCAKVWDVAKEGDTHAGIYSLELLRNSVGKR